MTPKGHRERHDEAGSDTEGALDLDRSAEVLDGRAHDVEADAASRRRRDLVSRAEAGLEEDRHERLAGSLRVSRQQTPLNRREPQSLFVDAVAVVGHLDDDCRPSRPGGHRHGGLCRFAGGEALRWSFTAMVDGIGHEVAQGIGDPVENTRVQLDVLTDQSQSDILVSGAGNLPHQLREGRNDPSGWNHRQAHRTVTHLSQTVLGVLHRATHLANGSLELVPKSHQTVHVLGHGRRDTRFAPGHLTQGSDDPHVICRQAGQLKDPSFDTTRLELGLAHNIQESMDASNRNAD